MSEKGIFSLYGATYKLQMFAISSVRSLLLTATRCLPNWVIYLADISVSPSRGCCHLKPTVCNRPFRTLWTTAFSFLRFLLSSFKLRETSAFFFLGAVVFFFFSSPSFFSTSLLAIFLFLSVQLTTLIRQPDNESQREAMHLQLRLLSASAGRVCPSRTACLCAFDCMLRL